MKRTTKNNMTLLQAMEKTVEVSKGSQMGKAALQKAKTEIKFLAKSYGITEQQAVLFSIYRLFGRRVRQHHGMPVLVVRRLCASYRYLALTSEGISFSCPFPVFR